MILSLLTPPIGHVLTSFLTLALPELGHLYHIADSCKCTLLWLFILIRSHISLTLRPALVDLLMIYVNKVTHILLTLTLVPCSG